MPPPASVSEARLSSVLDMAGEGIVVLDAGGTILVFNKACETLFGRAASDVAGRKFGWLLFDAPEPDEALLAAWIGEPREIVGRHRDGTMLPLELSLARADTAEGAQFIAILRDLRPRRATQERLARREAELSHLARVAALDQMGAALAHELNQPLTAATLYLQAADRLLDPQGAATEVVGKARREAERASRIVRAMRQFIANRPPEQAPVALAPLVEEAVELTRMGRHGCGEVGIVEAISEVAAVGDAIQIQQVVVNLVRNALDAVAGRTGARVTVTIGIDNERAAIAVSDNGTGVPPEVVADLFTPFATSKRSGLGLGLAISKTIAEAHGGDIHVEPGGEGRGATFTLILPLETGPAPSPHERRSHP